MGCFVALLGFLGVIFLGVGLTMVLGVLSAHYGLEQFYFLPLRDIGYWLTVLGGAMVLLAAIIIWKLVHSKQR